MKFRETMAFTPIEEEFAKLRRHVPDEHIPNLPPEDMPWHFRTEKKVSFKSFGPRKRLFRPVYGVNKNGKPTQVFPNVAAAAQALRIRPGLIYRALDKPNLTCRGLRWFREKSRPV